MNFDFSDEQKQLRDQARKFLAEKCPPKAVRAVLDGLTGAGTVRSRTDEASSPGGGARSLGIVRATPDARLPMGWGPCGKLVSITAQHQTP